MSEIQRYEVDGFGDVLPNQSSGKWVRFTDHEADKRAAVQEKLDECEYMANKTVEQVLADATARIEGIPNEYGVPPHTEYADGVAREAFRHGIGAALAALNQPQTEKMCRVCRNVGPPGYNCSECDGGGAATEKCPEDCDGFGQLIGDSDGPCPACSGLESDGGGAATAAGVADAEHERRLETNRLLWNRVARLEEALRVIRGPEDRGPWMLIYRNAGGGYAGLQAIAETALAPEDSEPTSYARAFRERVCPVPEFPGIRNQQEREA